MTLLKLICARKGSKRFPGKNRFILNGLPLVAHAIQHALSEGYGKDVWVSTDDEEILKIAKKMKVGVIERPEHLAGDSVHIQEVARHALSVIDRDFDFTAILYSNVFRRARVITPCMVRLLAGDKYDSAMTAVTVGNCHPRWIFRTEGGRMIVPEKGPNRMQDIKDKYYVSDGGVLIVRTSVLMGPENESLYSFMGNNIAVVETMPYDCVDIENEHDLEILT